MTPSERLDGYLRCGLDLLLDGNDRLVVRGPLRLRDAARPSHAMHRDELIAELRCQRTEAIERLTREGVPRVRLKGVA